MLMTHNLYFIITLYNVHYTMCILYYTMHDVSSLHMWVPFAYDFPSHVSSFTCEFPSQWFPFTYEFHSHVSSLHIWVPFACEFPSHVSSLRMWIPFACEFPSHVISLHMLVTIRNKTLLLKTHCSRAFMCWSWHGVGIHVLHEVGIPSWSRHSCVAWSRHSKLE